MNTYLFKRILSIFTIPLRNINIISYCMDKPNAIGNIRKRSLTSLKVDKDNICKKIKAEPVNEDNMSSTLNELISKHNIVVEETPVISQSDTKEYLAIKLSNGLRALLVSDVKNLIDLEYLKSIEENIVKSDDEEEEASTDNESCSDTDSVKEFVTGSENHDQSDDECGKGQSDKKNDEDSKEKLAACALTVGVGSFSDPEEIPGLAHFLEHMIFMGSKKYPKENEFDSFVSARGGTDNAETDGEYTTFYFDCPEIHLEGVLSRFSQFFVSPLMDRNSMTREREAVESEFQLSFSSDSTRCEQLLCSTATLENPAHKFMWGNLITLQQNVDEDVLHKALRSFWERHYSANRMTVAIQARLPINQLLELTATHFGSIRNNNEQADTFSKNEPFFNMELFNKIYTIEPVKETNKVTLTWAVPTVMGLYRTKPLLYMSHLLGHEGEGSLLALLQDKLWALGVGAGVNSSSVDHNSLFTLFCIDITLTDNGVSNIEGVLSLVFSYIKLLQTEEPSEAIFREIQSVHDMFFRFKEEEEESAYYVEALSLSMQKYKSRYYMNGDFLLFDYNPEEIKQYINLLTINTANIMILSKNACENVQLDMTEKWFSTKYNVKDIPEDWLSQWSNCELHPALHLPKPNPYITSCFDIFPCPVEDYEGPKLILNTDHIETWYKQDTQFKLPNAIIKVYFIIPAVTTLPQEKVIIDMFTSLFLLTVRRDAYPAKMASLDFSLEIAENGLILSLNGYNEKLPLLFEVLISALKSFITKVNEGLFEAVKEEIRKQYNNKLLKLSKFSDDLRLGILRKPYWPSNVKIEVIPHITLQHFQTFCSHIFENLYVKCLIQGNITEKHALDMSSKIIEVLNYKPLIEGCYPQYLIRKLPEGEKILRVKSFNTKDKNCQITNYYQCGFSSVEEDCKIDLLVMLIKEPLFDTLRTKEQLAYEIYCETKLTNGILGFSVTVKPQADKHSVDFVEKRISNFLKSMHAKISDMSAGEFNQIKDSLKILKQQADNDLSSVVRRYWSEIQTNEYMFDRVKQELKCIDSFKRKAIADRLLEITGYERNQETNTCKCQKLSVQIEGKKEDNDIAKSRKTQQETLSISKSQYEVNLNIPEEQPPNFITDIEEFKSSLYIYPVQNRFKKFKKVVQ